MEQIVADQRNNGVEVLPITAEHVYALHTLPFHHKDPFDRILVAQAMVEGADLLSSDQMLRAYPVKVIW